MADKQLRLMKLLSQKRKADFESGLSFLINEDLLTLRWCLTYLAGGGGGGGVAILSLNLNHCLSDISLIVDL